MSWSMPNTPPAEERGPSPILARPWLVVFLPVNAAISGFTVILPVIILFTYHSGVVSVALAITLYNLFLIPAAMLWGKVCDIIPRRRYLLLINYLSIALIFAGMALIHGLTDLLIFYSLFGWMAPSGAAASNLLIMERFSLAERATAFASFSEMNVVGGTVGILAGFLWVLDLPGDLTGFLLVAALLSISSAVMLFILVPERRVHLERASIANHPASLSSRLRYHYPLFIQFPTRGSLEKGWNWLKKEATHDVPLILAATFLFNFSANLFNTSYTPYLQALGLGASAIFLVNLSNNSAQVFSMPLSARASEGVKAEHSVVLSSWTRVLGYAGVFLLTIAPLAFLASDRNFMLGANLFFYGLLGLAVAFYTTSSSLLLFRSLEGRSAGTYIGFNSAFAGTGAVIGAGLSGVITSRLDFSFTFGIAALAMAAAIPVWVLSARAFRMRKDLSPPRSESTNAR